MGGFNNQNRYGATAHYHQPAANQHHYANQGSQHQQTSARQQQYSSSQHQHQYQQQEQMGYSSLPEYQMPQEKACAKPRQHLMPNPSPSTASEQPMVDSPTLSTTSSAGKDTAVSNGSSAHYHNDPYSTSCARVSCHQTYQQQQYGHFPDTQQQQQQQQASYYNEYSEQQQYPQHHHQEQNNTTNTTTPGSAVEEHYGGQYDNVPPMKTQLPYGTLHGSLEGYVSFVPYPSEEFHNPTKDASPTEQTNMSRVFLGQLPYQVTDMQLDWLCYTFGNGGAVHFPERITKHDPMRGCKVPTGCIHAYADNDCVTSMLNSMHKRILVDDTGVWFASCPEEQSVLNDYCMMMKNDRTKRYQNRPYDTVVAQFATSNFVRRR